MQPQYTTIPHGFCQCGCGQLAPIATHTSRRYGATKGQPRRFRKGHSGRGKRRNAGPWVDRFWSKVDKSGGPDACWPWLGSWGSRGYGKFSIDGKIRQATQVSWELSNDRPFPAGLIARHSCDNPPCVNPAHIAPGTYGENERDAIERGRNMHGSKTPWAKLTESDIPEIRHLWASGCSITEIATRYAVARKTIRCVVDRMTWRHVP